MRNFLENWTKEIETFFLACAEAARTTGVHPTNTRIISQLTLVLDVATLLRQLLRARTSSNWARWRLASRPK
jgi:hypothetical protein